MRIRMGIGYCDHKCRFGDRFRIVLRSRGDVAEKPPRHQFSRRPKGTKRPRPSSSSSPNGGSGGGGRAPVDQRRFGFVGERGAEAVERRRAAVARQRVDDGDDDDPPAGWGQSGFGRIDAAEFRKIRKRRQFGERDAVAVSAEEEQKLFGQFAGGRRTDAAAGAKRFFRGCGGRNEWNSDRRPVP